MALILRFHCQVSFLLAGSSPGRGKVTVALQVSLDFIVWYYWLILIFKIRFFSISHCWSPIRVNYCYGRLDFSMFSGRNIILCLFPWTNRSGFLSWLCSAGHTTVNLGRLLFPYCISCPFSSYHVSYVAPFSFLMEFQSFSLSVRSWTAILQKVVVCKCSFLNVPSLISAYS